jgi:hypothetical protein
VSRSTSPIATPGPPPQRARQLFHPPASRPATVAEPGPADGTAALDTPHQPTDLAHRPLQQIGVGRVVDVGLHHGGVEPQLAAPQQLVGGQLGQQRLVELRDDLRAGATNQLDQRGRMRHRPVQAEAAEPPPPDRVGDLPAQRLAPS